MLVTTEKELESVPVAWILVCSVPPSAGAGGFRVHQTSNIIHDGLLRLV